MNVHNNVTAMEVNGLVFEDEVINEDSSVDELVFENLEVLGSTSMAKLNNRMLLIQANTENFTPDKLIYETLFIPHNITVGKVNGEDFNSFLKQLCLKNIRNYIPETVKVNGVC